MSIENDEAQAIAIQSDGKIVVVGHNAKSAKYDIFVLRFNTNGSLDSSFDGDGIVITRVGSFVNNANAVSIQPDGKIVVAGFSKSGKYGDFTILRYNTDGSLDNSFDGDGIQTTTIGTDDAYIRSVSLQADGKIVVAGFSRDATQVVYTLARYLSNGSLDTSFDKDGIVTTTIGSNNADARSIVIQKDGKIIAAGNTTFGSSRAFTVVRYHPNGRLDSSFDTDGIVTTRLGTINDYLYKVALHKDGKIVVVGYSNTGTKIDFALVQYNTDGSLDNSFDSDGIVTTSIGTKQDAATALAIQADGKIVAAGSSHFFSGTGTFAIARYNNPSLSISPLTGVNKEISFYPNPTQDILHIRGAAIGSTVALYDMQGRMLKREVIKASDASINLQELAKGNYLLKITTKEGVEGSAKVLKE
ncbi:MAG: T9SS type A sorting domain-containing protein [Chitinophagaceae bacterium]|nr:T9SS type A sorting domain-containing protein [Chitinophagaceae bacterium]